MCLTLDFICLAPLLLLWLAKYKIITVYDDQSSPIWNRLIITSSPLNTSAKMMLQICVGLIQSSWHFGDINVTVKWPGTESVGIYIYMTGEITLGWSKKTGFRGNHIDNKNDQHQFLILMLRLSGMCCTEALVSKNPQLYRTTKDGGKCAN